MAVYVDPIFEMTPKGAQARRCGKRWCHMFADTLDELHEMAAAVGMKRAWFQNHPSLPHYDLVPSRRQRAVALGAQEVTRREMSEFMRQKRMEATNATPAG